MHRLVQERKGEKEWRGGGTHVHFLVPGHNIALPQNQENKKRWGHPEWGDGTIVLQGQKQKTNGLKLTIQSIR